MLKLVFAISTTQLGRGGLTLIDRPDSRHEPAFNAPWQAIVLPALFVTAFLAQDFVSPDALMQLALSSQAVKDGRWDTLFTSLFLHGGWAHVLMNAAAALAFGPPVARFLGQKPGGVLLFFLFFLIGGALAGLGFVLVHFSGSALVFGASGGVSVLWGAASRLLQTGRLAPLKSRIVISQALVFVGLNLATGLLGGLVQMNIAWEGHLVGYAAGLFLIGPAARLAGRSRDGELPTD